jgi:hypothetical protein
MHGPAVSPRRMLRVILNGLELTDELGPERIQLQLVLQRCIECCAPLAGRDLINPSSSAHGSIGIRTLEGIGLIGSWIETGTP